MIRNPPVRQAATDPAGGAAPDAVRRDLEWSLYSRDDKNRWVVRDPVSLEYFYLSDTEKTAADLLDGNRNSQQVIAELQQRHPASNWSISDLRLFVAKLQNSCLLMPLQPGQSKRLWQLNQGTTRRGWLAPLLSPIAIRVPVFDPTRILDWTSPLASLLFHRVTIFFWLITASVVFVFTFAKILPATADVGRLFQQFQGENAIWLLVSFAIVKSLHEFGHLLACRKWNSECHEVGLLFLMFVPCLYCDTSDSWKLTSRGKRAAIGAAGVYVELILATLAAIAWMVLQPGLLQAIAMNVMMICSIGTVLLNANPLLRYDGYYVLTDLWGVPNLAEQSREVLQNWISSFLTGIPMNRGRWDVHPAGLAVYGIAAWIYRLFVIVVILYVAWHLLEPIGLGLVAMAVILLTLFGLLYTAVRSVGQIMKGISMQGPIRMTRLAVAVSFLAACVWCFAAFPFTEFVRARAVATTGELTPIFASRTGETTVFTNVGAQVKKGSRIAEQNSPDLELESISLDGEIAVMSERVAALQLLSRSDPEALASLNGLKEQLQKLENQKILLADEIGSLTYTAPHDGRIVEGNVRLAAALTEPGDTGRFDSVWQERHTGMTVQNGESMGWLAASESPVLRAYVSGKDCERLKSGMRVRCRWDTDPSSMYHGTVEQISADPVARTPAALLGDPSFLSTPDASGSPSPMDPHYEVTIALDNGPSIPLHNALVTVHFETGKITSARWLWRFVRKNIRPAK